VRSIVSLGMIDRKKIIRKKDIEIYPWLSSEKRIDFMKNAKIIVFSGGHGTCFETIKYEKPSICIPTQPEQMGNAAKLQKLNCSVLVRNEKELGRAFETIESKSNIYNKKIRELNSYSRRDNGLAQTVKIIESL
jgi:UDP:flavonoid glycosyltransferase YjiC (YdhE family)